MAAPASLRAAEVEDSARDAAAGILGAGGDFSQAARAAIAVADTFMARLAQQPEVAESLASAACKAGCGSCCHQVVGITIAEEAMVVAAVNALSAESRQRLKKRVAAADCKLANLPVDQWQAARVPCPLLEDSQCVIHADRPLPCRAVLSTNAGTCQSWLAGEEGARIPLLALPRRIYSLAQSGLAQAIAAAGTPPGPVSLVEALLMELG
jgi:Fe-S-cluster containining protein